MFPLNSCLKLSSPLSVLRSSLSARILTFPDGESPQASWTSLIVIMYTYYGSIFVVKGVLWEEIEITRDMEKLEDMHDALLRLDELPFVYRHNKSLFAK